MVHSASANLNIIGEGWGYPPETVSFSLWVKAELADEEGANLPLTLVRRAHASQLLPQTLRLRGRQRSLVPVPRPYFTPSTKGREEKNTTQTASLATINTVGKKKITWKCGQVEHFYFFFSSRNSTGRSQKGSPAGVREAKRWPQGPLHGENALLACSGRRTRGGSSKARLA